MSDTDAIENNAIDGEDEMGSLNHSAVQTNLAGLLKFKCDRKMAVLTELSLDIGRHDLSEYRLDVKDELKPNICTYITPPVVPDKEDDLLKVSQMPDLAIEILSPRQAMSYLIRKVKAYFELGVKSCWLVVPSMEAIDVYSQPDQHKTFDMSDTQVIDEVMGVQLPIQNVFSLI